jgi:hypothetical protein
MATNIDATPTWETVAQMCIAALDHGSPAGAEAARKTILEMARVADAYNEIAGRVKKAVEDRL